EELASALFVQRLRFEQAISDAKATAKRQAFDEFLNDFKVEQRQFVRKSKLFFLSKQTLVLHERILFRNLPLCDWVERAVTLEETTSAALSSPMHTIDVRLAQAS